MLRFRLRVIAYMLLAALVVGSFAGCNKGDAEAAEAGDAAGAEGADAGAPDGAGAAGSSDGTDGSGAADGAGLDGGSGAAAGLGTAADKTAGSGADGDSGSGDGSGDVMPQAIAETSPVAITRVDMGDPEPEVSGTELDDTEENKDPAPNLFQVSECQVEVNGLYKVSLAKDLLAAINTRRKDYGISQLTMNTSLTACADSRCKEQSYFIGHFRPDGSPFSAVSPEGYVKGELVAVEYRTVNDIMEAFFSVNDSRVQMMNLDYTQIGVSIYDIDNTYYIAVEFGY